MEKDKKLLTFEYILDHLLIWYKERKGSEEMNDISVLKALKMLFFISAAKANKFTHSVLLEDTFDHFVAMPYGHVESDIYDMIRSRDGDLSFFKIDNTRTHRKTNQIPWENIIPDDVKDEIDQSVGYLKENYPLLILQPPFALVNLSHAWYSWQKNFDDTPGVPKSVPIPSAQIKQEDKFFRL